MKGVEEERRVKKEGWVLADDGSNIGVCLRLKRGRDVCSGLFSFGG